MKPGDPAPTPIVLGGSTLFGLACSLMTASFPRLQAISIPILFAAAVLAGIWHPRRGWVGAWLIFLCQPLGFELTSGLARSGAFGLHAAHWVGSIILGLPAAGLAAFAGELSAMLRRSARLRDPSSLPQCEHCGYNLTGNATRVCPECGRSVDDPPF